MTAFYIAMLAIGAVASFLLIGRYAATNKGWLGSPVGQLICTIGLVVGLFYTYYLVISIWPSIPGRSLIRLILFIVMTVAIVWRYVIFERLTYIIRREKRHVEELPEESQPHA